ncbi:MAG: hydantoinase B/oxoprolinase family protein [Dehalococcoidia bacterium]|nr:hydantoinase B/oxoprolinase family protein [Dehalococcoidia bacterium]
MPLDPIELTVFANLFASVAEEMGVTLGRAAYSPNIKERRDFSCAVFDAEGRMAAQAAHIPVHLGAMPHSVRVARERHSFGPGDLVIFNDPYLGGTHLPDVTMVSPVFTPIDGAEVLLGFLATRAHQSDIGGMTAGSMPVSTELYQEGLIIPPLKLLEAGRPNQSLLELIYRNVRTPRERAGDFAAQMAAHRTGEDRLREIAVRYGPAKVVEAFDAVMAYTEAATRMALRAVPAGTYEFEDRLDDDGVSDEPVVIRVAVTIADGELTADFTGSAPERLGSINAVLAVTQSATYYVVRCLTGDEVPVNDGCFRPVRVVAPEGSVLNPRPPRAVVAGNVETSQRVTDVLFGALAKALPGRIPAASYGTMSNLTIGGEDPYRGRPFAYYETIAGGMGAGPLADGLSAVHAHMTNTLNTPVEALEFTYPFRVAEYSIRPDSGGAGTHSGGDGVRRVYDFLCPGSVTLLTDRRRYPPFGLLGGAPGATGRNVIEQRGGDAETLPGKITRRVAAGDRLTIETPGGGGWGAA